MGEALDRLRAALADRYRIEREVGSGGMAVVFLAHDLQRGRPVALKVLRPEVADSVGAERFLQEIRIEARLQHPHILALLDSGESDGFVWYTMPYVQGESLRDRLNREQQLPVRDALKITAEVADAVGYAHGQGVIHRDIKPENILLADAHAFLADFGVAKAVGGVDQEKLTRTGVAVGTAVYMSPEQNSGSDRIDARSDQYSLACVLYEMLAGEPPFTGVNPVAVLAKKVHEATPHVTVVRDTVPRGVDRALIRALARTPADRFETMEKMVQALEADVPESPSGRRRMMAGLGGLVVIAAVAAVAVWLGGVGEAAAGTIESLVVLPFENASRSQEDIPIVSSLRDDIDDELRGLLVDVSLKSRTSALSFAESAEPLSEAGDMLEVDAVVEASFTRVRDSIRLRVGLVRTRPEERVAWSGQFQSTDASLLPMVNDVVAALALELGAAAELVASRSAEPSRSVSPAAYEAYIQGRYQWSRYTAEGALSALERFRTAVDLEPDFALAHAAMAHVYSIMPYYAPVSTGEVMPLAREAASRALDLDPSLASAHTALAWVNMVYDLDFERAESHFRRALELDPDDAVGHMWYAWYLNVHGRFEEAMEHEFLARAADPLAPRVAQHPAVVYFAQRDFRRVIETSLEVLEQHPNFPRAYLDLGEGYLHSGRYDEAIAAFRQALALTGPEAGGATGALPRLGAALAYAGRRDEALEVLRQLEERRETRYVPSLAFAEVHMALGEVDTAIAFIEQAYRDRDGDIMVLNIWPKWDPIREDPRFREIVRKAGLPDA